MGRGLEAIWRPWCLATESGLSGDGLPFRAVPGKGCIFEKVLVLLAEVHLRPEVPSVVDDDLLALPEDLG